MVEAMMRVKLPNSAAYYSGPGGDTQYESDYRKALADAKPHGYEINYPRTNEKWPVDSEGFTWVRLYVSDNKIALAYWMDKAQALEKRLIRLRELLKSELG